MSDKLEREDYTDPQCPFCTEQYEKTPPPRRIPTARVIAKLDDHLSRNDTAAAKRHLLYWLEEARLGADTDGELSVLNELMGLSRKLGDKENAYMYAADGIALMERIGLAEHVSGATTYLNAATVYKHFDEAARSLELYRKAQEIYERELASDDSRLGGLYNNMGLALGALGEYGEALEVFEKALDIMLAGDTTKAEAAITCLNIADLINARDGYEAGEEQISRYLDLAEKYLDDPGVTHDGNYAFICSKCAPVFGFYGRFVCESELAERAKKIYEQN